MLSFLNILRKERSMQLKSFSVTKTQVQLLFFFISFVALFLALSSSTTKLLNFKQIFELVLKFKLQKYLAQFSVISDLAHVPPV